MECKSNDNSEVCSNGDTRTNRYNNSENAPDKSHGASENKPIHIHVYEYLVCEQTSNGGTIVIAECSEWYHISCIGLPESRVDSMPNDVPIYMSILLMVINDIQTV